MATIIPDIIENASNKRWNDNKDKKHTSNASKGWFRYDIGIEFPVKSLEETDVRWNRYNGTLVVRSNDTGLYFYDIVNIKKEASTPPES